MGRTGVGVNEKLQNMRKYPTYKDSGIEWIGEIPEHWEIKRLKYLTESPLKYGANEAAEEKNIEHPRYIRITDFGNDGKLREDTFRSLPPEIAEPYLLKEGDLLFARSGATVGKTFLFKDYKYKACFAGYLIKASFNPKMVNSNYINYYTLSHYYENWKHSVFQQATIQNIGADKYNQFVVVLPNSVDEQNQIVAYLDNKTELVNTLISKKQKLIELLKEERTAVINQAVTKGLDPDAPMKDSGIEWLGEVPAHWEVSKMKFLCSLIKDGTHGSFVRVDQGFRLLSVRNIVNDKFVFREDDSFVSENDFIAISSPFLIQQNDIQLAIVGATLGKVAIVNELPEKFVTQRSLATIRADENLLNYKFLYYFIKSQKYQSFLWLNTGFSAQPGIYLGALQNSHICCPDLEEQLQIVSWIEDQLSIIDELQDRIKKEIKLLKEYKTALISEVVIGKVDVREEVPA